MNDGLTEDSVATLHRPRRLKPRLSRRLLWVPILVGIGAIVGIAVMSVHRGAASCADVFPVSSPATAVDVCREEYQRKHDPSTGRRWADAERRNDNAKGANEVISGLLAEPLDPPVKADVLQVRGHIEFSRGDLDAALQDFETARRLHRDSRRVDKTDDVLRDNQAIAHIHVKRLEFGEALRVLDNCIAEAEGKNRGMSYQCHLSSAQALIQVGNFELAKQEIEHAEAVVPNEQARIDLEYRRGDLEQEQGKNSTAISYFLHVLELSERFPRHDQILKTHLNLAYSYAETGELGEAREQLGKARRLDVKNHEKDLECLQVEALIAYRSDQRPSASSLYERVYRKLSEVKPDEEAEHRDDRTDVATMLARIAITDGDFETAARWAQRGIDEAAAVRAAQALELRPWTLAKRRAPYELRFVALARAVRVEDAVKAFHQWQAQASRDALVTANPGVSLGRLDEADRVSQLRKDWLLILRRVSADSDGDAVLATLRTIDLVALIVADDGVWRLTAEHGALQLESLGAADALVTMVKELASDPANQRRASALGDRLLPASVFRSTPETLHLLVDGKLGSLPVPALRRGQTLLVAMRPFVQALRLPASRCAPRGPKSRATVVAYAGVLKAVDREAAQVARLLGTTAQTGPAATRSALAGAADSAVLHIAGEAKLGVRGAELVLADGETSVLDILANGIAPSLVVLSACHTATSYTYEIAGSLAAGFLFAGSQQVVATVQSVDDQDAAEVATAFYEAGGATDAPRALARVQAKLARTKNKAWPYFAVFGNEMCPSAESDAR